MSTISCPSCGHAFSSPASAEPEPSVVQWFRADPGWLGELSTDEVYGNYLRAIEGTPVSRERFVADLAYLGVEEVLDDDTQMLVRT
jgi:hypothetical protein